jgi:hypothetical protein
MNNAALAALRGIATKSPYPFTLVFTREFTKGTLVGLTHDDKCGFCSRLDAEEWVASVNRANAKGKVEYRVVKWSVVEAG